MLDGKVAIVTGAASGIGRATAAMLAAEGAQVMLADSAECRATAAEIRAVGGVAWESLTDVTQPAAVRTCVADTVARGGRLDILVTAAGVGGGSAPTAEYADEDFERVLAVNLRGVFYTMKYALQVMRPQRQGSIVTIGSVLSLVGLPQTPAYAAAKGGVVQLTRVAALEYAKDNIRINCVCPGMIDTPMAQRAPAAAQRAFIDRQPLGRLGTAGEVARAVVFLASDAASFTTGTTLAVDGGFLAQ